MIDRSKQGIIQRDGLILKRHKSVQTANLEIQVARGYRDQGISVPVYSEPFVEGSIVYLPSEKVNGKSLLGNSSLEITKQLVRDLALFHELYSQSQSDIGSSVVYRDAIMSNFLLTEEGVIHLDFTSSDKFVHCFDDLALLLNKHWNDVPTDEIPNLVDLYLESRSKFRGLGFPAIGKLDQSLLKNKDALDRFKYYAERVSVMAKSGIDSQGLEDLFDSVDFEIVNLYDFSVFSKFREMRAKYYLQKVWSDLDEN